jgi:hypothetical protein
MSLSVFLSASIPLPPPARHAKYFETADQIAIRDSIRALISVVIPQGSIVFGGHPAITPMIRLLVLNRGLPIAGNIFLFQSKFFEKDFPPEVRQFENLVIVDAVSDDRERSLKAMREAMIASRDFAAGVFIGGMEGVEEEFEMFRAIHPKKPAIPIASTGAAALALFERFTPKRRELLDDLRYMSLFRRLLEIKS